MLEVKDPAIKLFGQTIPVSADEEESPDASGDGSAGEGFCSTGDEGSVHDLTSEMEEDEDDDEEEEEEKESGAGEEEIDEDKVLQVSKATENENEQQDDAPPPIAEESVNPETSPGSKESKNESSKAPSMDEPNATSTNSKSENEENEKGSSQEKTLKKPDKILPCPRCNSMDTKFCYYNNYNVNQPRHFCKNCQRYWTNGGTMRNVPVGAGRRKNKNAASHYRHVTISDALQTAQISAPNGIHHPTLKTNGTVLNFGSDATLSESMASVLNIAEKTMWDGVRNEYHKPEQSEVPNPGKAGENVEDHSSGCSTVGSNSMEESDRSRAQEPSRQNLHGFPSQIPCIPGIPWPYPWGAYPGIPMFYPPTYWNCAYPGAWPVPLLSPPSQTAPSSGPNSPTLGKHSRDGNTLEPRNKSEELPKEKNSGRNIWVPKTLRIDDPDEAAKSSIWATLGIKHESISKGGLFKGFQAKDHTNETDPVLQANPAALSRSLNFHESS